MPSRSDIERDNAQESSTVPFNLTAAIREQIAANPIAKAKEVYETLLADHPTIKKGSFLQSFYTQKKKASTGRKTAKRAAAAGMSPIDFEAIRLVKKLVSSIGADAAIQLIKAVDQ